MTTLRLEKYPWERLPLTSRAGIRATRRLARHPVASIRLDRFAAALGGFLAGEVRIEVKRFGPASPASFAADHAAVRLRTSDGSLFVEVDPEPQLASLLLARLLGRPIEITDPNATLEPAVLGALSALGVEAARAAGVVFEVDDTGAAETEEAAAGVAIRVALFVDGRPHRLVVRARERVPPTGDDSARPSIAALGLPVQVPVVAAASCAPRRTIEALAPGDVWFPAEGWLHPEIRTRAPSESDPRCKILERAALANPAASHGIEVGSWGGERLVLRGHRVALGVDADVADSKEPPAGTDASDTLTNILLEAPVVVRVEVGSVTLRAADWAALRPGDVLETGVSLGEPVVLRVAGCVVARGELVNVEGELGVQIRQIVPVE